MEVLRGKRTYTMDGDELAALVQGYSEVLLDIGTGDGRLVRHLALADARCLVVGIDACRENLRVTSRRSPPNALFVAANALALPAELAGLAGWAGINFPWGSLLQGLLDGEPSLLRGLRAIGRPGARLEVRLNGGALTEAGWPLQEGSLRVRDVLQDAGFGMRDVRELDAGALRRLQTTWARRLAHGRDPRGMELLAVRSAPRAGTSGAPSGGPGSSAGAIRGSLSSSPDAASGDPS